MSSRVIPRYHEYGKGWECSSEKERVPCNQLLDIAGHGICAAGQGWASKAPHPTVAHEKAHKVVHSNHRDEFKTTLLDYEQLLKHLGAISCWK